MYLNKFYLLVSFCMFFMLVGTNSAVAQKMASWEVLGDVTFNKKYDKKLKGYWLIPVFGKKLKALDGKKVIVEGYYLPMGEGTDFVILSKYPYSSCFFCGAAGPESVVEVQPSKKFTKKLRVDTRISFEGKLKLNSTDVNHCNYILEEARLLPNK